MNPEDFKAKFQEGWTLRNESQYEAVLRLADENLVLAQEAEDLASEALFLKLFAQIHQDQENLREALTYYKQMEKLYIRLEDRPRQMHTLRHIGMLFHELQEFECAEKCLVQVVEAYEQEAPSDLEKANTHRLYALALEDLNRDSEAKTHWLKAKELYERLWILEGVEECEEHLV